ncbi:MAG: phospho-N-acetylmuramoyl-pentapeptide-transferase [Bacteroidales bacterium]
MLYYLFTWLDERFDFPGAGMFQYITFRSAAAVIMALLLSLFFGRYIIYMLQRKQVGETIRNLGLEGQMRKQGTPTMGGLIILFSLLVPVLLFCDLTNIYILLLLITAVWLGFIGFLDDYIKVFKKNKGGLQGKFKMLGQISLGIIVGLAIYFHDDILVRQPASVVPQAVETSALSVGSSANAHLSIASGVADSTASAVAAGSSLPKGYVDVKSTTTTIPFVKNNEFDYHSILAFLGEEVADKWTWLVVVLIVIFIITAVSNGANITDGLDGLAAGTSAIVGGTLWVLAYVSGNIITSNYLNIMYLPATGEMVVFISAFMGATIGFLWYNTYPAQVFMGDTGSLSIGGIVAVTAILIRKELLIPILCGIFVVENLSVLLQVWYFKYTRMRYGEGKRIFLMAPLHHHFQKAGYHEAKIVSRFWIVAFMLAAITVITLKIR